ncbi:ABC transporter permease [Fretibacterium sp. OH1220_COT-178]|uniref:ABC transporter permease n=1 Tax=Fretibacterium sp. OH1220_COT-178 TaxID=2491047 RepID=UPI000F5D9F4B|nr:ABC transporter permease subunit [Fretibacterium sp. OH1220_COT-178]RRD64927.1 iron ABC transporter permease [Fretibacterium sp. OH1220_COT-178]
MTASPGKTRGGAGLSGAELALWLLVGALLSAFVLWPVGSVLFESLVQDGRFSLSAYAGLFSKNAALVRDSFVLAGGVTLCTLLIGSAVAMRLVYGSRRARGAVVAALVLSTISPPFLCSMAYLMLFGRRGLVTWRLLGVEWNPYGFHGVLMMETASLTGLAALLIAASLQRVDGALERASLDLGGGPLRTLGFVSLPLALPGIAAAGLSVFVRALSDFGTPLFVGGRFQVLASRAYNTLIGVGDFPLACAMNVLLIVPALGILCLREGRTSGLALGLAEARSLRLPRWLLAVLELPTWTFVAVQVMVYGLILLGSVTQTWGADFALTARHLSGILRFRTDSIVRSLLCSLAAGLGGCLLAAVLAPLLERAGPGLRRTVQAVADLPYLMPGTFFGVGYLLVSSRLPFEVGASFLIAMSCLFRQLSPSLRAARAGFAQVDPALVQAVRDLGGGPVRVLTDLLLPRLRPFMRLGFLNAFSAAMTTTGPIIFLVSPYARVAAIELFESINEGDFGAASAMGTFLILTVAAVNALAWRLGRRRQPDAPAR